MQMKIKQAVRQVLGGILEHYRWPERGIAWGGPFNGQVQRRRIFQEIVGSCEPIAIIETGTYRGTTTEFMAETALPIYTIEGHPRNFGFARARLWRRRNIRMLLGDSRVQLRTLFADPLRAMRDASVFAYLDAHWDADLPLSEELDMIFQHCPAAIVMIDDFQVPDDPGYGYDDYGPGKALAAAYVAPTMATHSLRAFYPAAPSNRETGACRGCVVLAEAGIQAETLATCSTLRAIEVPR